MWRRARAAPRDRRAAGIAPAAGWLEWAARAGYAARGLVFAAIGLTAAAVAAGVVREPRGVLGVLRDIARQPAGEVVTGALGIGLAAYAALNFVAAGRDVDPESARPRHLLTRAADAVTAVIYVGIAVLALRLMLQPEQQAGRVAALWAGRVLALPSGAWLLGTGGAMLVGSGLFLIGEAYVTRYADRFDRRALGVLATHLVVGAARLGTTVRGVVMGLCGVSMLRAAVERAPSRVGDVGDALAALAAARFGPVLLAVAALGFIGYGAYQLAKAAYRRAPMQ